MTPQNLIDYVKVYKNHISVEVCRAATKNLASIGWTEHQYVASDKETVHSYNNELAISYAEIPEKKFINEQIWFAIEKYILKDFAAFEPWFRGWNGYSDVRFNRYDPMTQMRLHCDHISSLFDGQRKGIPVLTVLGSLNDDYEGGEFIMFGDKQIDLPAGSIVIFPSNFMYPHEVKPIASGIRYSYVSWTW